MCRRCREGRAFSQPDSFWVNTKKDPYDALTILIHVLGERTENQGWFWVSDDAYDGYGRPQKNHVALHCGNTRARRICTHISDTPDFKAVRYAESLIPLLKFDECQLLSEEDKRALTALYWTRKAEEYERWNREEGIWQKNVEKAQQKAEQILAGSEEVSSLCGNVHLHPGVPVVLPLAADIRRLIEKIVDANFVPFLLI